LRVEASLIGCFPLFDQVWRGPTAPPILRRVRRAERLNLHTASDSSSVASCRPCNQDRWLWIIVACCGAPRTGSVTRPELRWLMLSDVGGTSPEQIGNAMNGTCISVFVSSSWSSWAFFGLR
jgi:hypothetical protein